MAEDWSREEVELTIASYVRMLKAELQGEEYIKAESWRALMRAIPRSKGAIEFKFGNISAVLLKLGLPYVRGYKPYPNYQHLLLDTVADTVHADVTLLELAQADAIRPSMVPTVDEILDAMVNPPKREKTERGEEEGIHSYAARPRRARPNVNYLELEAQNSSLGRAGEEFVLRFEQARLMRDGAEKLASQIEHVAVTQGDGLGYDILSYELSGAERLIEVKTTKYGPATPFFISRSEVSASKKQSECYQLYRIFNFRSEPRLFSLSGALSLSCDLQPYTYEGRVA